MSATLELVAPAVERPTLTFARLLSRQPDLDEATRLVVAMMSWPVGVDGCFIVRSNGDGFDVLGSHVESQRSGEYPLASLATSIDAIAHAAEQAPAVWTDTTPPMAAWELNGDQRVELVVMLRDPLAADDVLARIGDLVDILSVYVAGILAAVDPRNNARRARHLTTAPKLTPRQLQTLQLIERNFTMRQIASRIGFSESTIRMESLAIYRALGVHDRRGAVSVGRKLGLLEPERESALV